MLDACERRLGREFQLAPTHFDTSAYVCLRVIWQAGAEHYTSGSCGLFVSVAPLRCTPRDNNLECTIRVRKGDVS
jgi:hypothetical protein